MILSPIAPAPHRNSSEMLSHTFLAGPLLTSLVVVASGAFLSAPGPDAIPIGNKKAIPLISTWVKKYHTGKWNVSKRLNVEKGSLVAKFKLIPSNYFRTITYLNEIDLLCKLAREVETPDAARAILEVAAVR